MQRNVKNYLVYSSIGLWLIFTVSLVCWWIIFADEQLGRITQLRVEGIDELARYQRMLFWEGIVMIGCIISAAAAISYYAFREARLSRQVQLLFLTFAHEMKTPLASLRLQSEALSEDLRGSSHSNLVNRIVSDTARLAVQVENSLLFAGLESTALYPERLGLGAILGSLENEYPGLKVTLDRDCIVLADRRAFEAIVRNLAQNAVVHGQASELRIGVVADSSKKLRITIVDNGSGFGGDRAALGRAFVRHQSASGNGLGLFLVGKLIERMGGKLCILETTEGFAVELLVPGELT